MTQNEGSSVWHHVEGEVCVVIVTELREGKEVDIRVDLNEGDQVMFTDSALKVIPADGGVSTTYSEPKYSWSLCYTDGDGEHRRHPSIYRPESRGKALLKLLEQVVDTSEYILIDHNDEEHDGRAVVTIGYTQLSVSVGGELLDGIALSYHDEPSPLVKRITAEIETAVRNSAYFYIVRDYDCIVDTLRKRAKRAHERGCGGNHSEYDGTIDVDTKTVIKLDGVGDSGAIQTSVITQFPEDFQTENRVILPKEDYYVNVMAGDKR